MLIIFTYYFMNCIQERDKNSFGITNRKRHHNKLLSSIFICFCFRFSACVTCNAIQEAISLDVKITNDFLCRGEVQQRQTCTVDLCLRCLSDPGPRVIY